MQNFIVELFLTESGSVSFAQYRQEISHRITKQSVFWFSSPEPLPKRQFKLAKSLHRDVFSKAFACEPDLQAAWNAWIDSSQLDKTAGNPDLWRLVDTHSTYYLKSRAPDLTMFAKHPNVGTSPTGISTMNAVVLFELSNASFDRPSKEGELLSALHKLLEVLSSMI